jgi:hypothetical protein
MSPIRVSCIFCDQRREQAIEDIIPDWIAKEIGGKPPFTVDYFDDVRGAEAKRRTGASMAWSSSSCEASAPGATTNGCHASKTP